LWQVKWLGRVVITALIAAPFFLLVFLISPSVISNPYLFSFVARIIPYMAMPFAAFAFSDFCSMKVGLLDELHVTERLIYREGEERMCKLQASDELNPFI
jgi:hypothetical protein